MGCLCRNFHMLCDRQFQYTLVLLYICVKAHNVHRNKNCVVFHICLFGERHDFCDFDIGCSSVSTNFLKHRTRLYWIIKRKPNNHVLTRGWVMCFLSTTFPNAPAHPSPPILFDQSLRGRGQVSRDGCMLI